MKIRVAGLVLLALSLLSADWGWCGTEQAAQAPASAAAATVDENAWRQELAAWRAQREHELAAPDGWLTLVGLEWLKPGFNSFGAAADNQIRVRAKVPEHMGLLTMSGGTRSGKPASAKTKPDAQAAADKPVIQLLAPAGGFPPDLTIDGQPAREGPLAVGPKPSTIAWHGLALVVLKRGDRFAVRIKDADSPTRTGFHGLNWYAPDPRFRVKAHWIPFNPARIENIPWNHARFARAGHR